MEGDKAHDSPKLHRDGCMAKNPVTVFASGKSGSAFVRWVTDGSVEVGGVISGWEIYRYRQYTGSDNVNNWDYKGKLHISGGHHRSCTLLSLQDDCIYRFSVRCLYTNLPPLAESLPSCPCMVENPLPTGWYKEYYVDITAFLYVNIRTKEIRRSRPESDPSFLEDSVAICFSPIELSGLRLIFEEERHKFGKITIVRFLKCLMQVGESEVTEVQLTIIFQNFDRCKHNSNEIVGLASWIQFMDVMRYLKRRRLKKNSTAIHFLQKMFIPNKRKDLKSSGTSRSHRRHIGCRDLGDWVEATDALEDIPFYCHKNSGELRWGIPLDARTYLSVECESELLPLLDAGDLETLRQYFDFLDRTQSGSLSVWDMWPVGRVLPMRAGGGTRQAFLWMACALVDRDRNGYIEFGEFCTLMHCLASRGTARKSFVWRNVDYDYDFGLKDGSSEACAHLPLLSAIGQSILRHRDEWLASLLTEDVAGNRSRFLSPTRNRVSPLRGNTNTTLATDASTSHGLSCFCGCRSIALVQLNLLE